MALLNFIFERDGRWHNVHNTLMRRRFNGRWEYRAATDEEGGLG